MADLEAPDHYEMLQISPRADQDTIQRVFRHLAKRFHPDNPESGDAVRFKQLVESFQVLSDPEQRAKFERPVRPAPCRPLAHLRSGDGAQRCLGRPADPHRPALHPLYRLPQ